VIHFLVSLTGAKEKKKKKKKGKEKRSGKSEEDLAGSTVIALR